MLARAFIVALILAGLSSANAAEPSAARQRQARLAREAAILLRAHAVPNSEREAVLAQRLAKYLSQQPPACCFWMQCEPWLQAMAAIGAASVVGLTAMGLLTARPIRSIQRA